ncbi:MAG: hypothetical protein FJZ16_04210 [Candidatus Omnitrophica bacterium]|nr:hypothetical protein [Candidatus Omnitrophota bacterium]
MRNIIFSFFLVFCLSTISIAEENPFKELLGAKTIKCYWGKGINANWEKGKLEIETNVEWNPKKEESYSIYDSIDIKNGTARLIGNQGATDVTVLSNAGGITFIEDIFASGFSIITVFPKYEENSNKFLAVMTRHMNFMGRPLPQQYYGTAEILESRSDKE